MNNNLTRVIELLETISAEVQMLLKEVTESCQPTRVHYYV